MTNITFSDLTYNPHIDKFSDGCHIDWWVWEDVNTIWIHNHDNNFSGPMMDSKHLNARVLWETPIYKDNENEKIKINMDISRYGDLWKKILCLKNCTVRQLLNTISSFYKQIIDTNFILKHKSNSEYWKDALNKSQNGNIVYMYDLIGTNFLHPMVRYDDFIIYRRSPLLCNGCVRYEGVSKNNEIMLGS